MRAHAKYLRYVLRHKWFVTRAWLAIGQQSGYTRREWATMWWRALTHDLSKFSRAEWGPYVSMFYGEPPSDIAFRELLDPATLKLDEAARAARIREITRDRQAAFNYAWLHHQHANPHHWQHWVLREDSGKTIVLLPHALLADEMLADWLAAGPKALHAHTLPEAVAETIVWYKGVYDKQQLRAPMRDRIESNLLLFAHRFGIAEYAADVSAVAATRRSLTIG